MIEIPVHDASGQQTGSLSVDETLLGGEVRPALLKQAFVRFHANRRQGTVRQKSRADTAYSTRKLYRQKGTGNARHGSAGVNLMRHGGRAFARRPRDFRQDMPVKMRRLANRNAILAKVVDNEIFVVDGLNFDKPSTKQFQSLLTAMKVDRSCLLALSDTRTHTARSAANIDAVSLTQIDRINAFDVLNHRFLVVEKAAFEAYIDRIKQQHDAAGEAA